MEDFLTFIYDWLQERLVCPWEGGVSYYDEEDRLTLQAAGCGCNFDLLRGLVARKKAEKMCYNDEARRIECWKKFLEYKYKQEKGLETQ